MKHVFDVGQKVWRATVFREQVEIEVGTIVRKETILVEQLKNGSVLQSEPMCYYKVAVNDCVLDKCIDPYEWFESKEELIKHLFAGKE